MDCRVSSFSQTMASPLTPNNLPHQSPFIFLSTIPLPFFPRRVFQAFPRCSSFHRLLSLLFRVCRSVASTGPSRARPTHDPYHYSHLMPYFSPASSPPLLHFGSFLRSQHRGANFPPWRRLCKFSSRVRRNYSEGVFQQTMLIFPAGVLFVDRPL